MLLRREALPGRITMQAPLIVHIHVPKCAGTTIERYLLDGLGKTGVWLAPKRTRKFPLDLFTYKYDRTLPREPDAIKAVSGHFIGRSVENLFPGRRIVRSIILREPESLMLSYYNYRMMRYLAQGKHAYPFPLFLRATRMNPVAHFLLERWLELPWIQLLQLSDQRKAALLDEVMASIDFVADISETDALAANIAAEIGIPSHAPRRNTAEEKQAKTGWKIVRLEDLSKSEREVLKSRTELDSYLWRRWTQGENVSFDRSVQSRFMRSEFIRPRYQVERRLVRRYG
jgi:hypothetical protein